MTEKKHFPYTQIEEFDLRDSTQRLHRSLYRVGGIEISQSKKTDKQEFYIRTNTEVVKLRQLENDIALFLRNVFYQNLEKNFPS